jgi:hypothetical protein
MLKNIILFLFIISIAGVRYEYILLIKIMLGIKFSLGEKNVK